MRSVVRSPIAPLVYACALACSSSPMGQKAPIGPGHTDAAGHEAGAPDRGSSPSPGGADAATAVTDGRPGATPDGAVARDTQAQAQPDGQGAQSDVAAVSPPAGGTAASMRLISRRAKAFASTGPGNQFAGPQLAQDAAGNTGWGGSSVPSWLAYDLSATPAAQREKVLLVWNAINNVYLSKPPQSFQKMPLDYTIEVNAGPGGGNPPAAGWNQLANVRNNNRGSVHHPLELGGANWVRMTITRTSDPSGALLMDMDVYSAPSGATDSWLLMGDSITFSTFLYAFSDLPSRVQAVNADRWPAVINAALGGTGAITAVDVIDETMLGFPGRFVVLAYGTNDHPPGFGANMETLVKKVIAAGKIPVIPHVPWSDTKLTEGPLQNAAIDDLYMRYPTILRGPDLWAFFRNRTDLIPSRDVHPNAKGAEALRDQWAKTIVAVP